MTTQMKFAARMDRMKASEIRELLKLLDQPGMLSFAGGIPDPALFPADRFAAAYADALSPAQQAQALQYSVSEGYMPLRDWISARNWWGRPGLILRSRQGLPVILMCLEMGSYKALGISQFAALMIERGMNW